jgi:hypothetical protein
MEKLVTAIENWPVLIQGAIGSALFWVLLVFCQKLTTFLSERFSTLSKKRRQSELLNQLLRFHALTTSPRDFGGPYASVLWFRASRKVVKALIWLTFGLIFESIITFGVIGFIGCLYYLFDAYNIVRPLNYDGDITKKIREIEEQLKNINET